MAAKSLRLLIADCPHLEQVLVEFGSALLNQYQDYLVYNDTPYNERPHWNREQERHIATGRLFNTASFIVEKQGVQYQVSMNLADYWKNVEFGTEPHTPPYDDILNWVRVKPVIPRPYNSLKDAAKANELPTPEALAYMITRAISIAGTAGSHDLKAALEDTFIFEYEQKIQEAAAQDFAELVFMEINQLDSDRVQV